MGGKIKPRQQSEASRHQAPKKRSLVIKDMITRGGGGSHQDKREKRANNPKRREVEFDNDW
jgi:hypothetical protein